MPIEVESKPAGRSARLTLLAGLVGLTDLHVRWRVDGIEQLGLPERERWQAASPLPAFDHMARFAVDAVESAPPGPLVVADHGLGGFAEALGAVDRRDSTVLLAKHTYRHAWRLAPSRPTLAGDAGSLPVPNGSLAALVLMGIGDGVRPALRNATLSLATGGCVCAVGIVSADEHTRSVGTFDVKSLEWLRDEVTAARFADPQWAIASAEVGEWMAIDSEVAGLIARERRTDDRFDEWLDQRRLVHRLIEDRQLLVAAVATYKQDRI